MEQHTNNKSTIDLPSLLKPYISKWYCFIVSTLIFFIVGLIDRKLSIPVHSIKSVVLIKGAKNYLNVGQGNLEIQERGFDFEGVSTNSIEDELEIFKSKKFIRHIVISKNLQTQIFVDHRFKKIELYGQLELTDDLMSYLQKQNNYQSRPFNIGLNNNDSNNAITNSNKMILKKNRLLETVTLQNPLVIDITKPIDVLRKAVKETLPKGKVGFQLAFGKYLDEQSKLKSRIV